MKGFSFERQLSAYIRHNASSADSITGDRFRVSGEKVLEIGNNVTLTWEGIEFEEEGEVLLEIEGRTSLPVNSIHIRFSSPTEGVISAIAEFRGGPESSQRFPVCIPASAGTLSLVFLPGSRFDLYAFRFIRTKCTNDAERDTMSVDSGCES